MNPQTTTALREQLEQKYKSARANLGLMILLTVVNIILLFTGSTTMLLFSATVPYVASIYAMWSLEAIPALVIFASIAVISILLYALCWWQSKKRVGFMITALVLFILDTAFMVYMYMSMLDTSGILDILIHAWVIYYLVIGVTSGTKLKKLPEEEPLPEEPVSEPAEVAVSAEPTDGQPQE